MTAKCLFLSACLVLAATLTPAADTATIKANIRKLAAADFKTRREGATVLKSLDVGDLFYLSTIRDAIKDPEVNHSLTEIIEYLTKRNSQSVYRARKQDVEGSSSHTENDWFLSQEKTISATSTKHNISTSGAHAQSFVATKDTVSAMAVPITFQGAERGWARLDLVEDDRGKPTGEVLGQSWLYVTEAAKGSPHAYVFEFQNIPVRVGSLYWYVTQQITDTAGSSLRQNYRFARNNPYTKGRMWSIHDRKGDHEHDALFTVYSGTNTCNSLRAPTEAELKLIPEGAEKLTWTSQLKQ